MVTDDEGVRETLTQIGDQTVQGCPLLRGAGVFRSAADVEAALVTDADGVTVVVAAVCAYALHGTAAVDDAVARDVVMVADVTEPSVLDVVAAALLEAQALAFWRCRAMDDDECNGTHFLIHN